MEREEAQEKESCEKSASEESKIGANTFWHSTFIKASQPKLNELISTIGQSQFAGNLFPAQEEASDGGSSSPEDTDPKGFGELHAFCKQIGLNEVWPALRKYLDGNAWFSSAETRTVTGFAKIITKSDLELVIGNIVASNTLFQELQ